MTAQTAAVLSTPTEDMSRCASKGYKADVHARADALRSEYRTSLGILDRHQLDLDMYIGGGLLMTPTVSEIDGVHSFAVFTDATTEHGDQASALKKGMEEKGLSLVQVDGGQYRIVLTRAEILAAQYGMVKVEQPHERVIRGISNMLLTPLEMRRAVLGNAPKSKPIN